MHVNPVYGSNRRMARPLTFPVLITFRTTDANKAAAEGYIMPGESLGELWRRMLDEWLAAQRQKDEPLTETS